MENNEYIEDEDLLDSLNADKKEEDLGNDGDEESLTDNDRFLIHREDLPTDDAASTKSDDGQTFDVMTTREDCRANPNFAVIVDFLEKFGEHLGIKSIAMRNLESHLTETGVQVHPDLVQVFTSLLKRAKLPKKMLITKRSWEKGLGLFCKKSKILNCEFEELESQGYSQLDLSVKLRILKVLMEHQFDVADFKIVTETLPVDSLRHLPVGRDLDGLRYWTQIDETADIRVYVENCDHRSWENIVESRAGLVSLINKLKKNLLYRKEIIKRKEDEKKSLDNKSLSTEPEDLADNEDKKSPEASEGYKCAVCSCEFSRGRGLQAHYALTHLKEKLKDKFAHLFLGSQCKLCKEDTSGEDELLVHIATRHDKMNLILKENDLPTVADQMGEKETNTETECEVNNTEDDDLDQLEALQKKIKEVQDQMSTSVKSNLDVYALADMKDIEDGNITEKEEELEEVKLKKSKKKRRGRPRKISESYRKQRKSSGNIVEGLEVTEGVKERKESRLSCKLCGQWAVPGNQVLACPQCGHGWHQTCLSPALLANPSPGWQCPLCSHLELVASLDHLLTELDILMETVELKRLEELQENQSSMEQDEDEEDSDTEDRREGAKNEDMKEEEVKIPPDYYESSDEEKKAGGGERRRVVAACQCGGSGSCSFCKKMRGCTCEGAGTCRLCELEERKEEEEEDDDIEIIEEARPPPASSEEMSTTEYFLMTGKVRPPSEEAEDDDEDEIQVLEPHLPAPLTTRGRGRGRARGRARGARPVHVRLQRPVGAPVYRGSPTPRQGFVQSQMRPVRPPAVSGGRRVVRLRGPAGQFNYRSQVRPPVRPQQRVLLAGPRHVRAPAVQYNSHTRPPVPPGVRSVRYPRPASQYREQGPVVNLHTAYYDRASQGQDDLAAQYYGNITRHEVVDLSDDEEEEEQEAALISRLPSGIRISKI